MLASFEIPEIGDFTKRLNYIYSLSLRITFLYLWCANIPLHQLVVASGDNRLVK